MLYNTIRIEFILLLFVFGSLSVCFLLWSVKTAFYANKERSYISKAALLLCVSFLFAILFIRVTAPTTAWLAFFNTILCVLTTLALCFALLMFRFYRMDKEKIGRSYLSLDAFGVIDEYAIIFDEKGEMAASNIHKDMEAVFSKSLTMEEVMGLMPASCREAIKAARTCEIQLKDRSFSVRTMPIEGQKNEQLGTLMLWRDISRETTLRAELHAKNQRIEALNIQLVQELQVEEALLVQKEKEKLALLIKLTLSEKMNSAIKRIRYMQAFESERMSLQQAKEQNLKELSQELREVLTDIRKVVYETKR